MTASPPAPRPRSWPLLLLALTAFVPGIGFFTGAAALTWALLTERPGARLAIGLAAGGALLQVAMGAWYVASIKDTPAMHSVLVVRARDDLDRLTVELERYRDAHGGYPSSLRQLVGYPVPTRLVNVVDHSAGLFSREPYQYHVAPDGKSYEVFAVGPDGRPGTDDDIHPGDRDTTGDRFAPEDTTAVGSEGDD